MKIRKQLAWLVAGVVVPVALLAAGTTWELWRLQREAQSQRFLERVSALRLALDQQLENDARLLRVLAGSTSLGVDGPGGAVAFNEVFGRLLANSPGWSAIGWIDPSGRPLVSLAREGTAIAPPASSGVDSNGLGVSGLVPLPDGRFVTYVSVPVVQAGEPRGYLFAQLSNAGWLEFLSTYQIAPGATLTLSDRDYRIIARTLNNDRFVGKLSGASFREQSAGLDEGTLVAPGLEGQTFYIAFSRMRTTGWVLGTGVPSEAVEAELRKSTVSTAIGVLLTAALVAFFAIRIGARIIGSMSGLTRAAADIADPAQRDHEVARLAIDEAEDVRRALVSARALLATREAEREAAFAREAEARAHAERVNAGKDEFIAMLGHELRNPLSAIKSATTLISHPSASNEMTRRSRAVIERQVLRLGDLVDELLDVARLNSGRVSLERQPIDLAQVVRDVVETFEDSGRCRHLVVEQDLQPATVLGDETRLEQVVVNLLDNACKYTPAGGRVRIACESAGDRVVLVVEDSGFGIPADLLPRVFDVFAQGHRTLERAEGGLGLGLTVVHRLVTLHGGDVGVTSAGPGRGARFVVTLPRADAAHVPPPTADIAAHPREALSIVVVEDNADMQDAYRMLLDDAGHDALVVGDGERGAESIVARAPDAAIVDIGLPGIDGFEVARRVRAAFAAKPGAKRAILVAVTGYGTPADRERALAAGFDAFLVKPFDLETFEHTVGQIRATA